MMKSCGTDFQVASSVVLNSLARLVVGNHVYIAHNTVLIGTNISIGDEVLIGPNCVISSGNHTFLNNSFRYGPSISKTVIIGEGSWVGGNCSIIGGGTLPKQSILGAGSVLTKSFEVPRTIYAGVPAKPIKELTSKNRKSDD
jgi:acetyltransferase-like isoleucine patch superfamily enzyme